MVAWMAASWPGHDGNLYDLHPLTRAFGTTSPQRGEVKSGRRRAESC
jgi:hypothetical protein